jgi:hypothetical protein
MQITPEIVTAVIGSVTTIVVALIARSKESKNDDKDEAQVAEPRRTAKKRRATKFYSYLGLGLSITALLAAILPSFIATTASVFTGPTLSSPVGGLVASALSPSEMIQLYGSSITNSWLPADGQATPANSAYFGVTRRPKLPDLRGLFIRGLNEFESGNPRTDANKDPDGQGRRPVEDVQSDQFRSHSHVTTTPGGTDGNRSGRQDAFYAAQRGSTDSSGGSETRPRNVAVYYYIRIN